MKRKVLVLALVAMFMVSIVGTAFAVEHTVDTVQSPFTDVADNHSSAKAFALLNAAGIFEGYGDGTVAPDSTLNRAEYAKVAVSALNRESTAQALSTMTPDFTDANEIDPWARGWVNAAHATGLVVGRTDGSFDPDAPVTFAEAATMLVRALGYEPSVSGPWPSAHIAKAADIGLLDGLSIFYQVPITREEMAIMTHNALFTVPADSDGEELDDDEGDLIERRFDYEKEAVFQASDYDFGTSVALFGATTLADVEDTEADVLERGGNVVFIDADVDKTSGELTNYSAVSDRITVGGVRYDLADYDEIEIVINDSTRDWSNDDDADRDSPFNNAHDAAFDEDAGTFDRVFEVLEDEEVTLTFDDDDNVVKIEAMLDTFDNIFLAAVDVEEDEVDFGTINVIEYGETEIEDLDVNEDTNIWLNGERVNLEELEAAFEDFEDEWDSELFASAKPVITARTIASDHTSGAELMDVWVWTENIVVGEVTGRGSDYIRVDGAKYDLELQTLRDAVELGNEYTFLLDSEDEIVDILDTVAVDDLYFAKLVEITDIDGDDADLVVELADGSEVSLSEVDVETETTSDIDDLLGYVVVIDDDEKLWEVVEAQDAGAITVDAGLFDESTSSWIRLKSSGSVFPLDEDVFYYDASEDDYIDLGDLEENDFVELYSIDGVVGYVLTDVPTDAVYNLDQDEWFSTIQAAIDDADADDTIWVYPGTYVEDVTVNVDGLTLKSLVNLEAIIEGQIVITADVIFDGFEVEADVGSEGNAIFASGGFNIEIINSKVTANTSTPGSPGIVYIEGGFNAIEDLANPNQVTLRNNTFICGDLAGGVGVGMEIDEAVIENNHFEVNTTYAALEIWTDGESATIFVIDGENTFDVTGTGDDILIDTVPYGEGDLPIDQDMHF